MAANSALHPTDRTLQSYGLGKLDDASAESVNKHLEGCPECRRRAAEVSSDTFLGRLRDAKAQPSSLHPAVSSTDGLSMLDAGAAVPAPPPASTLPPGLADHPDYEVLRELGQGGMGVVYLAQNTMMGRLEVLKVVSGHLVNRKGVLDRFLGEIRNAARLHHPNIVTAYTTLRLGETLGLAMEYVEGLDLARLVKARGPLPVPNACNYIHQAALGLQHAHENGMVHRDIKPSNLMLTRQGNRALIKVLDFGLAKVRSEGAVDGGLTSEGQMLGTPHYIAPEQTIDARRADIRADIYSLGCTLYFLLTGAPPFDGVSLYDILQAHHSREALPLNLARPEIPVELAALVAKMMAKEPERRFQQPKEVAQALTPFFKKGSAAFKNSRMELSKPGQTGSGCEPAQSATSTGSVAVQPKRISKSRTGDGQWESLIEFRGGESSVEPASSTNPRRWPPSKAWPIALAGVLLCLIALGAIVITIRNKDGEAKINASEYTYFKFKKDGFVIENNPVEKSLPGREGDELLTAAVQQSPQVKIAGQPPQESSTRPTSGGSPALETTMKNSVGMTLKLIPAGEFYMGLSDDPETVKALYPWEGIATSRPRHLVRISRPFYLGACEVTQEQYETLIGANPSIHGGTANLPVDAVSWLDAVLYCNRLSTRENIQPYYKVNGTEVTIIGGDGYRLPTEAEWEYACRAGSQWVFPHGNHWHGNLSRAWMNYNSKKTTHPVGELTPNKLDLHDMIGNVWEWVWDWAGLYKDDGSVTVDPMGPMRGDTHIARGGCFNWNTTLLFTAWHRNFVKGFDKNPGHFGFRVARSVSQKNSRNIINPELYSVPPDSSQAPRLEKVTGAVDAAKPPDSHDDEEGFIRLFNGRDFSGLIAGDGNLTNWEIQNGALVSRRGHNRLFTEAEFHNFILRFEFQIGEKTMSSVGFWAFPGDTPAWVFLDNTRNAMAAVTWRNADGAFNVSRLKPPAELKPAGSWNEMEVQVHSDHIIVRLNGKRLSDQRISPALNAPGRDPSLKRQSGQFAFESPFSTGAIYYRKIRAKRLD